MYKWIVLNHIKPEPFGAWVMGFYSVVCWELIISYVLFLVERGKVNNTINFFIY